VPLAACGGAEPIPFSPPAISWIHPATLAGTWDYRGYSVYQAGCWHEGGGVEPLSCFTNRPPTSTFSEVGDSVLEVTDDAQLPAEIVLRDGRVQFAWKTADTIPVVFYDSVAAAPAPLVPGVHDLRKRIP
jgi:hypothetical protein